MAALVLTSGLLHGQSIYNQEISGQVQDASGSAVPNAGITVVNTETGLTRTAQTNEAGNYVVSNPAIGRYNHHAALSGTREPLAAGSFPVSLHSRRGYQSM